MTLRVRRLCGAPAIGEALARGEGLGLVLVREGAEREPDVVRVLGAARAAGVAVRSASARVLERMSSDAAEPASILALAGRRPEASLEQVFEAAGAVWLLAGLAYPTNAGMAIRTAEGSGAAGVVIDADWDHEARRTAVRASMRADWYMPVLYASSDAAIAAARAAGHRVVGIENSGRELLWDVDLRGAALFLVGGERRGIPESVLAGCDHVVRIPMAGFIPSYNVQSAVSAVAIERLRQLGEG